MERAPRRRSSRWILVPALGLALAAVACGAGAARPAVSFCTGASLSGRFAVEPGSAGAGNIVYRLTLRNRSARTCAVTGLPVVRLLARDGTRLPTHVLAARRGAGTAVLRRLAPGAAAHATARFSPDIPGPGEATRGACERTATRLRVSARGGGTTIVPIAPPTAVCEHGTLSFTTYGR